MSPPERKTILIVGAGPDQIPAIEIAREMGFYVVATDRSPSAPGLALADVGEIASTADYEATLAVARERNISGIMTLGSETAVPVVSKIAAELGLPGISQSSARLATDKNAMKRAMNAAGVPVPPWVSVGVGESTDAFVDKVAAPWVVKPSDCSGQRGITLVHRQEGLSGALTEAQRLSTDGKATVEEFVSGPELNTTVVANGGKLELVSISERITAPPPHFGIAIEHIGPPRLPERVISEVIEVAIDATRAIGISDGITYPQIVATTHGPRLIEIAARIPGGHMREVALHMSGVDLVRVAILQCLGKRFTLQELKVHPGSAVAVKFFTERDSGMGVIKEVNFIEQARAQPGVKIAYVALKTGDQLPALNSSAARFGAVIAVGETSGEAYARASSAHSVVQIVKKTDRSSGKQLSARTAKAN